MGTAALAWGVVGAAPAQAAGVRTTLYTTDGGTRGGRAVWTATGDHLQVCDRDADGWSVQAALQWSGSDGYTHKFTATASGNGNCVTVTKNIEDHRTAWLSVYRMHVSGSSAWSGYARTGTTS